MHLSLRFRSLQRQAVVLPLILLAITALAMTTLLAAAHTGHEAAPNADCASTSAQAQTGTPESAASPAPDEDTVADQPGLGTPAAAPCVTVTLEADKTTAGPRLLTVTLIDENGEPVADARVRIETRHLDMDHGTSVNEAVSTASGTYAVERVPMGMGGTWQSDVVVTRPGYEQVTVTFLIELEGPA